MSDTLQQVASNIWIFPHDEDANRVQPNVGIIVAGKHTVLIDAGNSPRHARRIMIALDDIQAPAVSYLIYTHSHWDHVFGAMVFGGVDEELLQLNEGTLWSGRPHDYTVKGAVSNLAEVRRLLFAGENNAAAELAGRGLMGSPVLQQSYQPLGDLRLSFEGLDEAADYRRELNVEEGIARVWYRSGGVTTFAPRFTAELFDAKQETIVNDCPSD